MSFGKMKCAYGKIYVQQNLRKIKNTNQNVESNRSRWIQFPFRSKSGVVVLMCGASLLTDTRGHYVQSSQTSHPAGYVIALYNVSHFAVSEAKRSSKSELMITKNQAVYIS